MLLATISITNAGTARLPFMDPIFQSDPTLIVPAIWMYALEDSLVLLAFTYDRVIYGRIHPAYLWGGIALLLSQVGRLAIIDTAPWQALTGQLLQLGQ